MKIILNKDIHILVSSVQKLIQNKNAQSAKKLSPLVNALLKSACNALNETDIERLSRALVTKAQHKAQITNLAVSIVDLYGEDYVKQLVQKAERKKNSQKNNDENVA